MWPNPQETADLVTFTEETLNGKLHFLCSVNHSNGTRTHKHLVQKGTLSHSAKLASLAMWLSLGLQAKWLWVSLQYLA